MCLDLEARERQAQALGSEEEEESGIARTLEQEVSVQALRPSAGGRGRSTRGCCGWGGRALPAFLCGIWVVCPTRRLLSLACRWNVPGTFAR